MGLRLLGRCLMFKRNSCFSPAVVVLFLLGGVWADGVRAWEEKKTAEQKLTDRLDEARIAALKTFRRDLNKVEEKLKEKIEKAAKAETGSEEADLSKVWQEEMLSAVDALAKSLEAERGKTLDTLNDSVKDPAHLGRALAALSDQHASLVEELRTEVKRGMNDVTSLSRGASDFKNKTTGLLAEQTQHLYAVAYAGLKAPATPRAASAPEGLANVREQASKAVEGALGDYLAQFKTSDGASRVVRCIWSDKLRALACKPALLVSGQEISEIIFNGLPTDKSYTVKVLTGGEELPGDCGPAPYAGAEKPECQALFKAPCPSSGSGWRVRLSCDEKFYKKGSGDLATIAVHKHRLFGPTYGGSYTSRSRAARTLRREKREKLSVLISSAVPEILVGVKVDGEYAVSAIPVAYARWDG
jgi:hypothetical protein